MRTRIVSCLIILLILTVATSSCDIFENYLPEDPPGDTEPGGEQASSEDPTPPVSLPGNPGSGNNGGLLKPVGFRNLGTNALTVQPWTYIPLNGSSPAAPSNASTVATPGGGNPSSYLSLPLGTYTWCYWWEVGDVNNDGMMDYAHAIDERKVVLDESDTDDLDLAEKVDLAPLAGTGELAGKCGAPPNPSGPAVRPDPRPNGELLFSDDCSGGGGAQGMFGSDFMRFGYQGGQGQLTANSTNLVLPAMYAGLSLADFIIEFDLNNYGGGNYGVIFRSDDVPDGLAFYNIISINPAGGTIRFAVWSENQWVMSSESSIAGEAGPLEPPLRFRLEAHGSEYRVFLNGNFAAEFLDSLITSPGIFGMSISTGSAPDSFTFDNLRVYSIP